jgi:UDP-N-acetylmuramate dehydrogenase
MPEILRNHPLRELNSFRFNVHADHFCECRSVKELRELLDSPLMRQGKALILGEGSNILFAGDYRGFIIRPMILGREIVREDRESVWIRAGAGENWDEFVSWSAAWGYGGIENLSLIPGSVGSSPIQNIGAYGSEVRETVEEVSAIDVADGSELIFTNESCRFGYRDSIFKQEWKGRCIITSVSFRLSKNPRLNLSYDMVARRLESTAKKNVEAVRQAIIEIRRSKLPDPAELGNAGSFFKNPVIPGEQYREMLGNYPDMPSYPAPGQSRKIPAAWLIEKCGWKGKRQGDAACYDKQPLVLVNYGSATGKEILDFAERIVKDVYDRFCIRLEKEVNVIE